jgi:hypothetical protein
MTVCSASIGSRRPGATPSIRGGATGRATHSGVSSRPGGFAGHTIGELQYTGAGRPRISAEGGGPVSIDPIPDVPEEPAQTPPRLRIVPGHEHVWQLRAVEYDESFEVRRYECEGCAEVMFR